MSDSILVFGAGGFVGKRLVHALTKEGVQVIALTRTPVPDWPISVETHHGTFDRPADFAPFLTRARAVVHLASKSNPGRTAGKPLDELDTNLRPTLALLDALQSVPHCELLYLSSGGTLYGDCRDHPAIEVDRILPKSYYGAGKATAEHFIHAYALQYRRPATILRPSNLYGPGQTAQSGFGIIPTAFDRIVSGTPLIIWGDGTAVRDYLYIDDFIELCKIILSQAMPPAARMFNASSGMGVSLNELLDAIHHITGRPLAISHDKTRSVDIEHIVLDHSLISQCYPWSPMTSLDQGLAQTWQWWLGRT